MLQKYMIILGLLAFSFLKVSAQNKLSIYPEFYKEVNSDQDYMMSCSVYSNGNLISKLSGPWMDLENLPNGTYQVRYQTFFGEQVSEDFELTPADTLFPYVYDFCVDVPSKAARDSIKSLFLDDLKENEEIQINYKYGWCFNEGEKQISITKDKGRYYTTYKGKKRRLKKRNEALLKDFEVELRCLNLPDDGMHCTSSSHTSIVYKGQKISASEECPGWDGFSKLLKALNLKW